MNAYRLKAKEVLSKLKSTPDGLSVSEARSRRERYGKNIVEIARKISFFVILAKQFKSYLAWLLMVVAAIALGVGLFLGQEEQIIQGIVIMLIVLINAVFGAYQEYKSEKVSQLLKSLLKNEAVVKRGGKKSKIDAIQLVPGDIIFLSEGDKIPADCRIIGCSELKVDESLLTGESVHVLKNIKKISKKVPLAERKNMVYMNTFVTRGQAVCLVTATGKKTEVGKIAKSLEIEQDSLFMREVDRASKKITYVALSLILIALAVFVFHNHSWLAMLMLGAALIVGSIPEGLLAVVTFTLSMGSSKLAKKNVLIKHKTLLETLGSVDVICTDKTGTLTENKMTVKKLYVDGKVTTSIEGTSSPVLKQLSNSALLCNEAKSTEKGFLGDAEDIALIDLFETKGFDILELRKKYPQKKIEPFSSERKFARSFNVVENKTIQYSKGASEVILKQCSVIFEEGKVVPLNKAKREEIQNVLRKFSEESLRNIAFSFDNVFIGFVGVYDPPQKETNSVIKAIYAAGIELKMITGDNIHTAKAIAKECGFKNIKAVGWKELNGLSKKELAKRVESCNVFARMSPQDKLKIVSALQNNGSRVAITGDGVNDVPALKQAEVGVAMGKRGSDIAKEAADLELLDDNFGSIILSVKEGRIIFSNIRKVINYLLTANLAEVLVVFVASLLGLQPFLAIQLLWVNFVTDVAPAMALGIDPAHKNIMKKKPTGKNESLIDKRIVWLTVGIGLKKVVILLLLFLMSYKLSGNLALAQTMAFTWLVLSHFVRVAAIRFDEGVSIFINKALNWSIAIPLFLQIAIIYSPLGNFFHTIPLTIAQWMILIASFMVAIGLAK